MTIYQDSLISITESEIVFKHYYFPSGKQKRVRIADIERITVRPPTLWNGKWRLQGTGNLKTWFPMDCERFRRDRIFIAALKGRWIEIGFTVVDGDRVEQLFRTLKLL